MSWRPSKTATPAQAKRAVELLRTQWQLGLISEEDGVQYHGAYHPNYPGQQPDLAAPEGKHRGVEVWVQSDAPAASPSSAALVAPWKPDPSRKASPEERELVLAEFEKRGWPRVEADAMVAIESGWDATAHNVQRFGGLIGFSPTLQRQWGVYPVWETLPTAAQQAPLVGRYLDEVVTKHWRVPGDTYMTGAAPSFVGASDDTVVYRKGSKAWEQNPGWRPADGGDITAGSIRATLLRKIAKGGAGGYAPPPKPKNTPSTIPAPAGDSESALRWSSREFFSRLLQALKNAPSGHRSLIVSGLAWDAHDVIREFQQQRGLDDDGRLGPATLGAALDDDR